MKDRWQYELSQVEKDSFCIRMDMDETIRNRLWFKYAPIFLRKKNYQRYEAYVSKLRSTASNVAWPPKYRGCRVIRLPF